MKSADIWATLGIAPTTDQAALRLAYAERLKRTRPDIDPAGFRALREAFDAARRMAGGEPVRVASPPDRGPIEPITTSPSAGDAIRKDIADGRYFPAAQAWSRAVANGELSFDEEPALQEEIAKRMLPDHFAALDMAAELMRWEEAARALRAPAAIVDIMARRAAENWLCSFRAAAKEGWRWRPKIRARNRAAKLLLRPPPGQVARYFPYVLGRTDFDHWLRPLAEHRRWVRVDQIPVYIDDIPISQARIDWCIASRRRLDARLVTKAAHLTFYVFIPFVVVVPLVVTAIALLNGP